MDELQSIVDRFERRKILEGAAKYHTFSPFQHFSRCEREFWYARFLANIFGENKDLSILEIGAGSGDNIIFFRRFGVPVRQIFANELLPERAELLKQWLPGENILLGDAANLDPNLKFDIVFQSTVFTSILENDFRQRLAKRMWELTKPGGIVLWYDFEFNNPRNPDVRGVPWQEVRGYFPHATHVMKKKTTLAPPIGRRVGRLYNFLNFPFLRTHCIAAFKKDGSR
jgi:SAM-dependent methyltransferase